MPSQKRHSGNLVLLGAVGLVLVGSMAVSTPTDAEAASATLDGFVADAPDPTEPEPVDPDEPVEPDEPDEPATTEGSATTESETEADDVSVAVVIGAVLLVAFAVFWAVRKSSSSDDEDDDTPSEGTYEPDDDTPSEGTSGGEPRDGGTTDTT